MNEFTIKVEGVGKKYTIGKRKDENLRHTLANFFHSGASSVDEFWALEDISFDVRRGDVIGIVGKNGAGKSTLLKILSRITKPTTGRIELNGRVASLLEVGTGFHPELTGRENIFLNGTILGMSRNEVKHKFDEIVDFSGVGKFIDTPVKHYSSGMYVRLAFAVAAHLEPEILVIDEVLAVGDAEFQKKCLGKMGQVANEGRTVLFVSHNMGAVKSLCQSAILLEAGRQVFRGATDQVVARYLKTDNRLGNVATNLDTNGFTEFEINKVVAKAKGKGADDPINNGDEIVFIIECLNRDETSRYDVTLRFKGEGGEYFMVCSSLKHSEEVLGSGLQRITLAIPRDFFNEGVFYLDLLLIKNSKNVVVRKTDLISFTVNPADKQLGRWTGKSPGFLKPGFDWVREELDS